MPLSSGLSIHDDTKHKGSAKRDTLNGVAGLNSTGDVLGVGSCLFLTRDGANKGCVKERTSNEMVCIFERYGANNYALKVRNALGWSKCLIDFDKDVANGIAGLDANIKIPYALLDFNNSRAPLLSGSSIDFSTGSDVFHAVDTVNSHNVVTYTKVNDVTLDKSVGSLRVSFDLWSPDGTLFVYGQVYKNGASVGTVQSNNSVTPVNYIEYIGGWSDGDLLQLYTHTSNVSHPVSSRNFRILCDISGVQIG